MSAIRYKKASNTAVYRRNENRSDRKRVFITDEYRRALHVEYVPLGRTHAKLGYLLRYATSRSTGSGEASAAAIETIILPSSLSSPPDETETYQSSGSSATRAWRASILRLRDGGGEVSELLHPLCHATPLMPCYVLHPLAWPGAR